MNTPTTPFKNIEVLSFDWDGVITRHGEILKQQAWDSLAASESTKFKKMLAQKRHDFSSGGGSRYDILRHTFEALGLSSLKLAKKVLEYAARYQSEVMKLMVSDVRPDAKDLLSKWQLSYALYVNSSTAEDWLRLAAGDLGLKGFFKKIYGYPAFGARRNKADVLRLIMKAEGITDPKKILHIGDSENDYKAATTIGCSFVGVANEDNGWKESGVSFPLVPDLWSLSKLI